MQRHRVEAVGTGGDVLRGLDQRDFDLILMACQMPQMNGFEATSAVRERERAARSKHTPIIALTAHALKGDEKRCLAACIGGYLSKPNLAARLYAAIDQIAHSTSAWNGAGETCLPPKRQDPPTVSKERG